jgi:hypothetical protein
MMDAIHGSLPGGKGNKNPVVSLTIEIGGGLKTAVKSLLPKVRTEIRRPPTPEPSFASQISLAVFQQRRASR